MRSINTVGILSGCLLLAGLSISGAGLAQAPGPRNGPGWHGGPHGPGGMGPPPGGFIEKYAEQLGLDADTRDKIREIAEETRARGEKLREERRDAQEELRGILSQENPEESAVMKQADAIGALELAERKNRLQALVKIRMLLTPEQRQELIAIRDEARPHKRHRAFGACREDLAKLCPDARSGRMELRCLDENWEGLSDECRSGFEPGRRRAFRPGSGFGPPER